MPTVGYQYLIDHLGLRVPSVRLPAVVGPVTRVEMASDRLQIPKHVAPMDASPMDHLLFALKHEGTNLQVLEPALRAIPAQDVHAAVCAAPNGAYAKIAGALWEHFNNTLLEDLPPIGGPSALLFDAEKYVTGPEQRIPKWKVVFNGLGSLSYSPVVRMTPAIREGISANWLGQTNAFGASLGRDMLDRAVNWAYLSETESSFEIEREVAGADKARLFMEILRRAHDKRPISEEYLVELQGAVIRNPIERAAGYRHEQNWLQNGGRGAAGVTYIPPAPELLERLMPEIEALANSAPRNIDPIVAAAVSSFGFVFAHPFMDGNGRVSRFLFHHALCISGQLENGLLLPISVAMKKHEDKYLEALRSFSGPSREFWASTWIGESQFKFSFNGSDAMYRYWDATPVVEFSFEMAREALNEDLKSEVSFLERFDHVYNKVNESFDLRGSDLATLVRGCLQHENRISNNLRKRYADRVQAEAFNMIEDVAARYTEKLHQQIPKAS